MKSLVAGLVLLATVLGLFFDWAEHRDALRKVHTANEHNADSTLRILAHLQSDSWTRDLDRDGGGNYWAGEVAGLVRLHHSLGLRSFSHTEAGAQCDSNMASHLQALLRADPSVPDAQPYHGYWFVAVKRGDPHRFGFCAYPADYGRSGRRTYIVDESRSPTARDMDGQPVLQWPTEIQLQNAWPRCISG